MTTDEADSQQKKPRQQGEPEAQDPGPSEPQDASPASPQSPGSPSPEEEQLKPRTRTSAGRGLSRLFSSFLKRRSQCEGEAGEKDHKGEDEPKAPIADPEPELRLEGDAALDQHSVSSVEAQVQCDPLLCPTPGTTQDWRFKSRKQIEANSHGSRIPDPAKQLHHCGCSQWWRVFSSLPGWL